MQIPSLVGIVILSLLASSCVLVRGSGGEPAIEQAVIERPDAAEQFEFVMTPGKEDPAWARQTASGIAAATADEESFRHVASVRTPTGVVNVLTWDDGDGVCAGMFGQDGAAVSCGEELVGPQLWSSDTRWESVLVRVPDGTTSMLVTTTDGTEYTVQAAGGFAVVVAARVRGQATAASYIDATGTTIGTDDF